MISDNKDYVRIIYNSAKCLKCGDVLVSRYRHHFVTCTCKSISVDGGNEYARRVFGIGASIDNYQDLTVYSDAPFEEIREVFARGSLGKKGNEPLHWVMLKDMTDDHLANVIEYCERYNQKKYYEYYIKEKQYREEFGIECKEE